MIPKRTLPSRSRPSFHRPESWPSRCPWRSVVGTACVLVLWGTVPTVPVGAQEWEIAQDVTIRRTDHGVPHIMAATLEAAAFGLAYAESEDHGSAVFEGVLRARGTLAALDGTSANVESDFVRIQTYDLAGRTYDQLRPDVRQMMEGFAKGMNHYLALHPDEVPEGMDLPVEGVDIHALTIGWYDVGRARRFVRELANERNGRLEDDPERGVSTAAALGLEDQQEFLHPDDGSNAWALAPDRTASQRAILLRNPHLSWDAGYYEAHLRVPGVLDFYGDFRIGGLFGIIAGFNPWLGWATTNNGPDLSVVYRLNRAPGTRDAYVLDGTEHPVRAVDLSVAVRDSGRFADSGGMGVERRTVRTTDHGPIIHEDPSSIYIIRSADHREFRRGEQFMAMMLARSFDEWRDAMRMHRISASNYTYADRDGNIFYVWNAKLPRLPHPYDRDEAVSVSSADDMWTEFHPWDSLPQLLNPEGGYLRNENDPPYFTNLNAHLPREWFPENMPEPRLRLRSQHSLELLHGNSRYSLEDVVEAKHSMRMLLADRVKADLMSAVRIGDASPQARQAVELLRDWDNTVARDSRGGVLFKVWWDEYTNRVDTASVFAEAWDPERPTTTPRGLGSHAEAARAFEAAVVRVQADFGSWDIAWGDAHRVRRGSVDVPVGGCSGGLGCFRVLAFSRDEDRRWVANRGDGWVLAVEFGDSVPRAYSVLAYGQSSREESPYHADQAALFADNAMKPVAFTEDDILARARTSYRPGEELGRR